MNIHYSSYLSFFCFIIYNDIFNHLEDIETLLQKKRATWKKLLADTIPRATKVLRKYYFAIIENLKELLYILAIILHPAYKLEVFTRSK